MTTKVPKSPHSEALRYLANAKETLVKAKNENGIYKDVKYVQTASGTAYNGVLIAVDEYLRRKEGIRYTRPKSIEEYRTRLAKQNKSLLKKLNFIYDTLHLAGYYHGTTSVKTITEGLTAAKEIVSFI